MKLFNLTSRKLIDTCAKELALDFSRLCPLPEKSSAKNKLSERNIEQVLAEIFSRAKAFRQEHHLGIFKRARFAKVFQDELANLGYEPALINKVTTALVTTALSGS